MGNSGLQPIGFGHQGVYLPELYDFIRSHHLAGTGIGWVDAALLASARAEAAQLATFDTPLTRCARQLDVPTPVPLPASDQ